ncbi:allatostatin-A receptor-like [Saccoglossus kowalevskii]
MIADQIKLKISWRACVNGCMDRCMGGWIDMWTNGWSVYGWMDGMNMNEWVEGRKEEREEKERIKERKGTTRQFGPLSFSLKTQEIEMEINNSDNTTALMSHNVTEGTPMVREVDFNWVDICKSAMGIIGAIGNAIVIIIVLRTKKLQSITNTCIVSLAVADLFTSVLIIPYPLVHIPSGFVGELVCRFYVSGFLLWMNFDASVFNLMVVTAERYFAVVHPIKHKIHFTKKMMQVLIIGVWALSVVTHSFCLYIWQYDREEGGCKLDWPGSLAFQAFNLANNKQRRPALSLLRAREKIVKMLFIVVLTFGICWAPNQFLFLCYNFGMHLDFSSVYYHLITLTGFCNSCMNPFIYGFQNKQFRQGFVNLLGYRRANTVGDSMISNITGNE